MSVADRICVRLVILRFCATMPQSRKYLKHTIKAYGLKKLTVKHADVVMRRLGDTANSTALHP